MVSKIKSLMSQYYPPRATFTEAQLLPGSQTGRVFIVTGGNAGIGFELCKLLVTTGAVIYMASRSKVINYHISSYHVSAISLC